MTWVVLAVAAWLVMAAIGIWAVIGSTAASRRG